MQKEFTTRENSLIEYNVAETFLIIVFADFAAQKMKVYRGK
jgi:hypothetical protein